MHKAVAFAHNEKGDIMNDNKELLNSILNTVQMGQVGIRSVLDSAVRTDFKKALRSQLKEYDSVETQAHSIAASRGLELKEVNPAVRTMADMMSRAKLCCNKTDSRIAAMMIQGNTRGMIIGLKDQHRYTKADADVKSLSQKLLDCEHVNIQQMQGYL